MRPLRIFILEDDGMRNKAFREACIGADVTIATSMDEVKEKWTGNYDILCLDHDLGGKVFQDVREENSGSGFVRWLLEFNRGEFDYAPTIVVHSYNAPAARRMVDDLDEKGYPSVHTPFGTRVLDWLKFEIEQHAAKV